MYYRGSWQRSVGAQSVPELRRLLQQVTFIVPYFSWQPSSTDPGDEHVIECALNAVLGRVGDVSTSVIFATCAALQQAVGDAGAVSVELS